MRPAPASSERLIGPALNRACVHLCTYGFAAPAHKAEGRSCGKVIDRMNEFEGRMQTILDAALDAAFSHVRHGGDHESRKLVAATLLEAARSGTTALDELTSVARRALIDLRNRSAG
ncbi:hypothetical protein C7U92_24345 [Bradyrhizobium sp. WBOS7]|uniref:Uncharacterized protein n=1 Tax=Bradyrhizobium betae TaxID=244734 RepID=A0AAE9N847_9BRAD|nr:hypothetical protein [Bradyrhizobium sp. WBOS2]MDD1573849.1 hypothetical protein [Bradyrhizobium sp. WBOS1]MDD1579832.1 hypothetical protein [Bradyrhizobium sp. WBOS7]MDD1602892.1 hypothetical protein [Bradyrhizobium sp. WBOS16]UUO34360.1 hypothetical protein DCK84_07080 [Bradyrhizobium sp. WBOS01]UUO40790.1 hypothetical protein DCM75_08500 [Bradyrhizobium sp. WBOS02]UUO52888.1 hypothetical protein DCM79_07770 [Bradyrhizobium sp. WBOS07]UUO65059.1 hypothetical protein DCM83_07395 [Bradyrh